MQTLEDILEAHLPRELAALIDNALLDLIEDPHLIDTVTMPPVGTDLILPILNKHFHELMSVRVQLTTSINTGILFWDRRYFHKFILFHEIRRRTQAVVDEIFREESKN